MEDYEDLKKRVDHLQYDEIKPLREELNDMKIALNSNNILTEQTMESNKKLSDTMDAFKDTMIEIAQSVKDSNRVTGQLADTVNELNVKISSVESNTKKSLDEFGETLDKLDEKSKVDILEWVKSKWFELLISGGAIAYFISQLMDNK